MITGDSKAVADSVARRIGIDEVAAEVLPADKASAVKRFQSGGRKVAMVGDGVNDAPALASADVGIAIGAGTDVAIESAGIVLVRSDPRDVVGAIELSRATYRKMIQNLVWATTYNLVAIPIAAGLFVQLGTRSAHERRCSRDESLHHHRRCERSVASPTETAACRPIIGETNRGQVPNVVRDHVNSEALSQACLRPCSRSTRSRSRSSTVFRWALTGCSETLSQDLPLDIRPSESRIANINLELPEEAIDLEEIEILLQALEKSGWNQTQAAKYRTSAGKPSSIGFAACSVGAHSRHFTLLARRISSRRWMISGSDGLTARFPPSSRAQEAKFLLQGLFDLPYSICPILEPL